MKILLVFVPKMDPDKLVEGFKNVLRNIYSPKEYYQRALACISHFHHYRAAPRRSDLVADLRSFCRTVLRLGVLDDARNQFWKYFYKLVRYHPHDFAHGLALAAMGFHFRKLTQKYCG